MKLRHAAALALGIPVAGCWSAYHGLTGATASQTYTANGKLGYTIHCDGAILDWGDCKAKAGKMCTERGYDVIESHKWGFPISRSMIIACK